MSWPAVAIVSASVGLLGCAPTAPVLAGGTTTPAGRGEIAFGGASRLPFGELATLAQATAPAPTPGGVAPVVQARVGVNDSLALGLTVAGSQLVLDGGYELWVDPSSALRPAIRVGSALTAGLFDGGARFGGDIPVLLTLDATSVVGFWGGVRVGLETAQGGPDDRNVDLVGWRLGGIVGMAFGFRDVHGLIELTVAYEGWRGSMGDIAVRFSGIALTPAFALRFRL